MNRILIIIALIGAIFSGGLFLGYQLATGQVAKKTVKVANTKIENHNEDTISLQRHSNDIAKIQKSYEKKLRELSLVPRGDSCNIGDFERVWNEAISITNSVQLSD